MKNAVIMITQSTHLREIYIPLSDIFDGKGTDGATRDSIVRRGKNAVNKVSVYQARGGLNVVKVEWMLPRHRTIKSTLEKCRPIVPEFMRSALVRFANAGHA